VSCAQAGEPTTAVVNDFVSATATMLCTDEARFIIGQSIVVRRLFFKRAQCGLE
jgi:hypothetical protein